jgi:hypothetical protein
MTQSLMTRVNTKLRTRSKLRSSALIRAQGLDRGVNEYGGQALVERRLETEN